MRGGDAVPRTRGECGVHLIGFDEEGGRLLLRLLRVRLSRVALQLLGVVFGLHGCLVPRRRWPLGEAHDPHVAERQKGARPHTADGGVGRALAPLS